MRAPISTHVAMVATLTIRGMIEASATRRFCTPFTRTLRVDHRGRVPTHATGADLMEVRGGAVAHELDHLSGGESVLPGITSRLANGRIAAELPSSRHNSMPSARAATSSGCDRNAASRIGLFAGSADCSCNLPRLFGATRPAHSAQLLAGGLYCLASTSLAYGISICTMLMSGDARPLSDSQNPAALAALLRGAWGSSGSHRQPPCRMWSWKFAPTSGASTTTDAVATQIRGVADTAEHQDLRGVDTARAQDDLARGPDDDVLPADVHLDAGRPVAAQHHPAHMRLGQQREMFRCANTG